MKQTIEIEVPDGYNAVYDENTQRIEIVVKIGLPKTWEEFCDNFPFKKGECFINHYGTIDNVYAEERYKKSGNILPNKETAEAFLALMQLIQLRDCYRQGWKPDWGDYTTKHCIICLVGGVYMGWAIGEQRVLSFQSAEIRDEFLKNFKNLIEKAKGLISL